MPGLLRREEKFSAFTGVIFLFNLIVGTGALALPGAVQKAGYVIGIILLITLAVFSFITVTFVLESMAAANALSRKRYERTEEEAQNSIEETPLVQQNTQEIHIFEITEKYEIGQMGVLMSPKWGQIIIYLCLCIYLFGDLAIYVAVIGKSGSQVICTHGNETEFHLTNDIPCWKNHKVSRMEAYRISVAVFIFLLGPFVFFNLQKTKFLQFFTLSLRWLAFFVMLAWSILSLSTDGVEGHPPLANFDALPTLFGTLVYSYMCQHSIPGLLQPIRDKRNIRVILSIDFFLVSLFYLILCLTAIFTFKHVMDIYTLNFWQVSFDPNISMTKKVFAYYLGLFPFFTLSTSFPIIAITLKNNLRCLFLRDRPSHWYYDRLIFPLVTILPPTILALSVSDVQLLVGVVGSYAGTCVQYLIPCILVIFARSQTKDLNVENIYASPFKNKWWLYAVYAWMAITLIFITINYVVILN